MAERPYLFTSELPQTIRKRLSQTTVEKLAPDPRKVIERPHHETPALRLVVQPSGHKSWAVRCRIGGKTAKLTIGEAGRATLADALKQARAWLDEIDAGHDPRVAKRRTEATTLKGVAELYLADRAADARPRTQKERERHLRVHWAPLHDRPLAKITKTEVATQLQVLLEAAPTPSEAKH